MNTLREAYEDTCGEFRQLPQQFIDVSEASFLAGVSATLDLQKAGVDSKLIAIQGAAWCLAELSSSLDDIERAL